MELRFPLLAEQVEDNLPQIFKIFAELAENSQIIKFRIIFLFCLGIRQGHIFKTDSMGNDLANGYAFEF